MTKAEHELMILVFAKQLQQIKTLLTIMKSRGIIESDDPLAFATIVSDDVLGNVSLLADARQVYLKYAKHLKVQTGLES